MPDAAGLGAAPEDKGWIGERYDAGAGLQYLNARYYDPRLGLFLQPDWFEVTEPGVGTNRYAYSFNDPVNRFDPGGNNVLDDLNDFFSGLSKGASNNADFDKTRTFGAAGATAGAIVGAGVSATAGCATTLCVVDPVAVPMGAAGGAVLGGTAGGLLGMATDGAETLGGGMQTGLQQMVDGHRAREEAAAANDSGAERVIHGNSTKSPRQTELYHLINRDSGAIDKIGVTSAPNAPTGRYSRAYLESENVDYVPQHTFQSRAPAYVAENIELLHYFISNGRLPRLNRVLR